MNNQEIEQLIKSIKNKVKEVKDPVIRKQIKRDIQSIEKEYSLMSNEISQGFIDKIDFLNDTVSFIIN